MEGPLPADLLIALAEQISSRSTLASLCLVSKYFNKVFTAYLYRNVYISPTNNNHVELQGIARLPSESHLSATKSFYVRGLKCGQCPIEDESLLMCCLGRMPNLVSFSSMVGVRLSIDNDPELPALRRLQELPSFTDLLLRYGKGSHCSLDENMYSDHAIPDVDFQWPCLTGFKNLRKLDLQGLSGDPRKVAKSIAGILIESPNLKVLGLSVNLTSWVSHPQWDFHPTLLFQVNSMRPGGVESLLALEELTLGLGAIPRRVWIAQPTVSLSRLTDLSRLKSLRIINYHIVRQAELRGVHNSKHFVDICPDFFFACKNLRKLSIGVLNDDATKLVQSLRSISASLREIEMVWTHEFMESEILEQLGVQWRRILCGTKGFYPEIETEFFKKCLESTIVKCENLEELCMPFNWPVGLLNRPNVVRDSGDWPLLRSKLGELRNLRILSTSRKVDSSVPENSRAFVLMLFSLHKVAMRAQGLTSKLQYIGIGENVYTRVWLPNSRSRSNWKNWQIIKLSPDEALAFDSVRALRGELDCS